MSLRSKPLTRSLFSVARSNPLPHFSRAGDCSALHPAARHVRASRLV